MYLSFGERPVCLPVRTTSGPLAARMPSSARTACSYRAAGVRFTRRVLPRAGMSLARRTNLGASAVTVVFEGLSSVVATGRFSLLSGWVRSVAHAHFHLADRPRVPGASVGARESAYSVRRWPIVPRLRLTLPNGR